LILTPQVIVPVVLVPLIGFRLYRRFRANFGRQTVQTPRVVTRLVFLALVIGAVAFASMRSATVLEALAGGLVAGAALGLLGLRHTKFESDDKGSYYTPNSYIGGAVTLLFIGRIIYRMTVIYTTPQVVAGGDPFTALNQSPLTVAMLMLTLGYYAMYSAGVLLKSREHPPKTA
jgi:hypothetical protein